MERLWARVKQLVRENDLDAEELIDEYLAEHVDMVNGRKRTGSITQTQGWGRNSGVGTSFTSSGTYSGGHDDPSTDTKSLLEPASIP